MGQKMSPKKSKITKLEPAALNFENEKFFDQTLLNLICKLLNLSQNQLTRDLINVALSNKTSAPAALFVPACKQRAASNLGTR